MTATDAVLETVLTVFAALLAVPILAMGVVLPLMGPPGWGHASTGTGSWAVLLMPAIPLVVLIGVGYLLSAGVRDGSGRETDGVLEELRFADARAALSDEQFAVGRDGRQSLDRTFPGTEVSEHE